MLQDQRIAVGLRGKWGRGRAGRRGRVLRLVCQGRYRHEQCMVMCREESRRVKGERGIDKCGEGFG